MINPSQLLKNLQVLLRHLEADLLERSTSGEAPGVIPALETEYQQANEAKRTAYSYAEWRSGYITQIAVAWVLSAVFVRFLEDNELVNPPKLSGVGERRDRARDEYELYFRQHPTETDREYLLQVFADLRKLPGVEDIFGENNPIHTLPNWLSGDAAGEILKFFQDIDPETGKLIHDFTDSNWDTRFLGDLYQDLSEATRKQYALLQTPIFVEEFILDRTLDPAIETFGLDKFRMIDPACGSGHFLLGSLHRILERWQRREPGTNIRVLAQRALDSVYGVDVNPYAVAIARFRLLLAVMGECDITQLKDAPAFQIHVACGDSLLHGTNLQLKLDLGEADPSQHYFQEENAMLLKQMLAAGTYHAVVANPPYITPKDKALNQAYRQRYSACYRKYSLSVPFMERIFELAVEGGFTGQITANSFMKREFGKRLIEDFLPQKDLTYIVDTSGAYIPGHGTPTLILFGRNRKPIASTIRTVMGIRGEPSTPENPLEGLVWSAIVNQVDVEGSESEFVSVANSDREMFKTHPWSLTGGGASELKEWLDANSKTSLGELVDCIGFSAILGEDEAFGDPPDSPRMRTLPDEYRSPLVEGNQIRDWGLSWRTEVLFPYNSKIELVQEEVIENWLWTLRTTLYNRPDFSRKTYQESGRTYWEYHQIPVERNTIPLSITFAFVASHNHFVIDRGGKVFKQSAPVIKLSAEATEEDYLALLSVLNSSTACFWMKQVSQIKTQTTGMDSNAWQLRREFDGTKLYQFPLTSKKSLELSKTLDGLAQNLIKFAPKNSLNSAVLSNLNHALNSAKENWQSTLEQMIAWQEELDWQFYRLYGIIQDDLTYNQAPPPIKLGERAFEIIMARKIAAGKLDSSWFERHGSQPITELPQHWSKDYQGLVKKRLQLIENNKNIRLIEKPENKRRWTVEPWDSQLETACQDWLLDRLETYFDFDGRMNAAGTPTAQIDISLTSVAKLTDVARRDSEFMQVGELYRQDPAFDVQKLVSDLVEAESVPFLPALRYKPSGLRKRVEWEKTWELQRREDDIDKRTQLDQDDPNYLDLLQAEQLKQQEVGEIRVPPKYKSSDFLKTHYWKLRGKLDVPKERWVSFPYCEGADTTLVIAWAGYDHLQLAQGISAYFVDVQERLGGSEDPRLEPLLACLIELLPWLKQWHNDIDPTFNLAMGDYFESFIQEEARKLEKTLAEIRSWQPPKRKK